MNKGSVENTVLDVLSFLSVLLFLNYVFRFWIAVILCLAGAGIALAVRQVLRNRRKQQEEAPVIEAEQKEDPYGSIQKQITKLVTATYPNAEWVWERPDARRAIVNGEPIRIFLNRAGGYRVADVAFDNGTVSAPSFRERPPKETKSDPAAEPEQETAEPMPENYDLIAYEWAEIHALELNDRCNEAIGRGEAEMLLTAAELPSAQAWEGICRELKKAGLETATVMPNGIRIEFKQ